MLKCGSNLLHTIVNLANLKIMFIWLFGHLLEEIEFSANAKSSMRVSPFTAAMPKLTRPICTSVFSATF